MNETAGSTPAANLHIIETLIASATRAAGRPADCVVLIAVSKGQSLAAVRSMLEAGQTLFGENRVQEAAVKFPTQVGSQFSELHLIGPLQTNKAADAVKLASMIETLDRPSLADAIARAADRIGCLPKLLVQVNVGSEPQKTGIATEQADNFIEECQRRFGDKMRGLMCVPPVGRNPVPYFQTLATLAARHGLPELSMGMSADFEHAIACGSTMVRVGSALFGHRKTG